MGFPRPGDGRVDRCPREIERGLVDDDASAPRIERRDHGANGRQVELAGRPAPNHVDLCLAGPVDIRDTTERAALRAEHLGPDDLVPERLALAELRFAVDRDLEVRLAEAVRRGPVADLAEADPPTRSVLDGPRRNDGQR